MNEKELTREVHKAAQKVYSLRTDLYLISFRGTVLALALAGVLIVGFVMQFFQKSSWVGMTGVALILAAAVAIIVFYLYQRRKGPLNYVSHTFVDNKTEYIVQVVGKDRFLVQAGGKRIGYEKGVVVEDAPLLNPECLWGFLEDASFDGVTEKNGARRFSGVRARAGGTDSVKVILRGGFPDFAEVNGVRLRFFDINQPKKHSIVLPDELAEGMKRAGIPLPATELAVTRSQTREIAKNGKNGEK